MDDIRDILEGRMDDFLLGVIYYIIGMVALLALLNIIG